MPIGTILFTIVDYSVFWSGNRKDCFQSRDEAEGWARTNISEKWSVGPVTTIGRVGG